MWKKSSFSGAGGTCVEVAPYSKLGGVQVRDSNNPDVILTIDDESWKVFLDGVKAGEFD